MGAGNSKMNGLTILQTTQVNSCHEVQVDFASD